MSFMIYGANGYTGELIAREAVARGMKPILAGRTRAKVERLASELNLECRIFDLGSPASIVQQLHGVTVVLLTAGPFSATSQPMVRACIEARAHYLDITGEIDVFEEVHRAHSDAQKAGVVLCPGVGFDVIPTDCVAAALKEALPDAVQLSLGFDTTVSLSPGTMKTTLESTPQGGRVRRHGHLVRVPLAHEVRRIDFGRGERLAVAVPWGDVSTAFHTTGIPNITVYVPASRLAVFGMKLGNVFGPFLAMSLVQRALTKLVSLTVKGPDEAARARMPAYVWGEAINAQGERRTARVKTANGYTLTIPGALAVTAFLLSNDAPGGFTTPSRLMGHGMLAQLPGGGQIIIE
ncbi:saccharopine dehydrogenase NADP-binding domain-containing protein [Aquabacterium sp.]|uniref:saccharopine dehydrogenase family protein n=1 Tax=Aquabacterium sp. TaxID=1872578 RepID=UPI0019AEC1F9|nr:saccharopine dehydrogenase NADP-binding domain-containing protein [Aquabacterium sp.]MBC7701006.1 saccharopine dehydrogenase NADP-binding domain-containing protein [Aquabacterium sp.]